MDKFDVILTENGHLLVNLWIKRLVWNVAKIVREKHICKISKKVKFYSKSQISQIFCE